MVLVLYLKRERPRWVWMHVFGCQMNGQNLQSERYSVSIEKLKSFMCMAPHWINSRVKGQLRFILPMISNFCSGDMPWAWCSFHNLLKWPGLKSDQRYKVCLPASDRIIMISCSVEVGTTTVIVVTNSYDALLMSARVNMEQHRRKRRRWSQGMRLLSLLSVVLRSTVELTLVLDKSCVTYGAWNHPGDSFRRITQHANGSWWRTPLRGKRYAR